MWSAGVVRSFFRGGGSERVVEVRYVFMRRDGYGGSFSFRRFEEYILMF